jgi:hypothetical protein
MANADIGLHREPGLADPDDYGNLDVVAPGQKIRREELRQRVTLIPTPDKFYKRGSQEKTPLHRPGLFLASQPN